VIAAVSFVQTPATAAPAPALQQPPTTASDALTKYRDLAAQAEKLSQAALQAQADLTAKQAELDKATQDLNAAKDAGVKAAAAENQFRAQVDKFAGASFTSGAQMNKLSALLAGNSAQDFLQRSSALDVLATDKNAALSNLTTAVAQTAAVAQKAADAQARAQAATDAAAKLKTDLAAQQKSLQAQITQIQAVANQLSAADQGARSRRAGGGQCGPEPARQAVCLGCHRTELVRLFRADAVGVPPGGHHDPAGGCRAGRLRHAGLQEPAAAGRPGVLLLADLARGHLPRQRPDGARAHQR
jgi:hypothetical protein